MNEMVITIDFGSTALRCVAGSIVDRNIKILAKAEVNITSYEKGAFMDFRALSKALHKLLRTMEDRVGEKIEKAYFNVSGRYVKIINDSAIIEIEHEDRLIEEEDVEKIHNLYYERHEKNNWKIVDLFNKIYTVDNFDGIPDPVGMISKILSEKVLLILIQKSYLNLIMQVLKTVNIEPQGILVSPFAVAEMATHHYNKDQTNAIIDCGGKITEIYIMKNKMIQFYDIIGVGGHNITKDIAYVQEISDYDAEVLKKSNKVELPAAEEDCEDQLMEIIKARIYEILELLKKKLKDADMLDTVENIIITGQGLTLYSGIEKAGEAVFGIKTSIDTGKEIGVLNPEYFTSIGILKYVVNEIYNIKETPRQNNEAPENAKGFIKKVISKLGKKE